MPQLLKTILHYLPFVLLFAIATMIIYGWGLWRSLRQNQDLNNMLTSKGISRIKKALRKNGKMTKKELEPFVKNLTAKQPFGRERIGVTNPSQFLNSLLPYMVKQEMIKETKEKGKVFYSI
ncbi:MAG: hypothetical protein MR867_00840 [Eubacterium sp.]|nr:hypothetical protein [Eubacterium sp.]MDD7210122.1 hypothetical protein [Lachnospiraceae bacterium]MDY5496504.1 hypothetical protein [Anaerobutyricum sp.]